MQNGPGAPLERPKQPGGDLGAFETAWERLGSVRNGPGTTRERPKWPEGASVVSKTVRSALEASKVAGGRHGTHQNGPGVPREHAKWPRMPRERPKQP